MKKFKLYRQRDQMDCGPTCLKMIARHYGANHAIEKLRGLSGINKHGVSFRGILEAARDIGLDATGIKINIEELKNIPLPAVLHWRKNHFVVLYNISRNKFHIADPGKGILTYGQREFSDNWGTQTESANMGFVMLFSPNKHFEKGAGKTDEPVGWKYIFRNLHDHRQLIGQLMLGLLLGSIIQLIMPFLMQSLVDRGIGQQNMTFVYIIVIAQVTLFIGKMLADFLRSWILLHVTSRLNITILTEFWIKLMRLPMNFFDTKLTGDIMQRINDQGRIQTFLTGPALNAIFSTVSIILFTILMIFYDRSIFLVFLFGNLIYFAWVYHFLGKRKELDFKRFDISAKNQSVVVQLINGIQEIKLNNCEEEKRFKWEDIQADLFHFNIKSLKLGQAQQVGAFFINEGKNILITFLAAHAVIEGNLSLGAMMAIQFIVGQANTPVEQMVGFIQQMQDARISLERLNEIHSLKDEESLEDHLIDNLQSGKTIDLKNLSFRYPGAGNQYALKNINLSFHEGKTTAVVGMSGSGKTTLLKLLLKFYKPSAGAVDVGGHNLEKISPSFWRANCGTVMQDGFIFSDTIINNICVKEDSLDIEKLAHAIKIANIGDLIDKLPLGLNTQIGSDGNGISAGQKQRILIARAVYKDPHYVFFDEATNALDAKNEAVILENLNNFFAGKTVIIVAHRLSTVKNADNIILLDNGVIAEQGTHNDLIARGGAYYSLVKNQLELDA
ncbi:peptidase domain-containing ABC transporter [uncultured Pedobacter sp.]|uniref:peptidase domain-containing ABC transporter n=1 Tax=uncultured Pedobacter sp. TaxID=246139 RepID=UPI0025E8CA23|nr:peptidase domain-containing ABC transporter [uncultured Pedobacter sp.]